MEAQEVDVSGALIAEEDFLRASLYAMLGGVLAATPDGELRAQISAFEGDDSPLGLALAKLGEAARTVEASELDDEFHTLFVGINGGELNPYGSFYLTGFMYEKPLADLRADMAALGIAPADGMVDPEDHIGSLCEMMAGLITGAFGDPLSLAEQRKFFDAHIISWAERFFEDLERSETAQFYGPLGTVGRLFLELEKDAFKMVT